jgi:hypothetical protein
VESQTNPEGTVSKVIKALAGICLFPMFLIYYSVSFITEDEHEPKRVLGWYLALFGGEK